MPLRQLTKSYQTKTQGKKLQIPVVVAPLQLNLVPDDAKIISFLANDFSVDATLYTVPEGKQAWIISTTLSGLSTAGAGRDVGLITINSNSFPVNSLPIIFSSTVMQKNHIDYSIPILLAAGDVLSLIVPDTNIDIWASGIVYEFNL